MGALSWLSHLFFALRTSLHQTPSPSLPPPACPCWDSPCCRHNDSLFPSPPLLAEMMTDTTSRSGHSNNHHKSPPAGQYHQHSNSVSGHALPILALSNEWVSHQAPFFHVLTGPPCEVNFFAQLTVTLTSRTMQRLLTPNANANTSSTSLITLCGFVANLSMHSQPADPPTLAPSSLC